MALEQKTDHVARGLTRLITQFQNETNVRGMLSSYLEPLQEIENVAFDLLAIVEDPEGQVGAQLDLIGRIVGQPRNGLADADYIPFILARQIVNRSSGLPDEIMRILNLLISNTYEYTPWYPAAMTWVIADAIPDVDALASLLGDAKAGGVRLILQFTTVDDDETFTFADADAIQADVPRGFSEDPELVLNWDFADWTGDNPDSWTVVGETGATHEISEVGTGQGHGGAGTDACNLFSSIGGALVNAQTFTTVAGNEYRVTLNISLATTGQLEVKTSTGDFSPVLYSTTGEKTFDFTAAGAFVGLQLTNNSANIDLTVDDISVAPLEGGVWADAEEA